MSRLEKEIEPHPKNILKPYQIAIIVKSLKEWGNL